MFSKAFSILTLAVVFYAVFKVAYSSPATPLASNHPHQRQLNDDESNHKVPILDPLKFNYPKDDSGRLNYQHQPLLQSRSIPDQQNPSSSNSNNQVPLFNDEDIHYKGPATPAPIALLSSHSKVVQVDNNGRVYDSEGILNYQRPGHPSGSFWPDGSEVYLDWSKHAGCSHKCYEADQYRFLYDCMMSCTAHLIGGAFSGAAALKFPSIF